MGQPSLTLQDFESVHGTLAASINSQESNANEGDTQTQDLDMESEESLETFKRNHLEKLTNPNFRPTHNQHGKRQNDYSPEDMAEILRLEETLVEEHAAIKDLPAIVDLPRLYTNGNRINKTQLTAFDTFITNLQASNSAHDVKLKNKLRGINLKKTHEQLTKLFADLDTIYRVHADVQSTTTTAANDTLLKLTALREAKQSAIKRNRGLYKSERKQRRKQFKKRREYVKKMNKLNREYVGYNEENLSSAEANMEARLKAQRPEGFWGSVGGFFSGKNSTSVEQEM